MVEALPRHDPVPSEPVRFEGVTVALVPPARRYSLRMRVPAAISPSPLGEGFGVGQSGLIEPNVGGDERPHPNPVERLSALSGGQGGRSTPEGEGLIDLPTTILTTAPYASGAALKLAPDEWLLLLPADAPAPSIPGIHSLVDVSERSCALTITGPNAAPLLQTGCPLDLAEPAFPIGKATRTVFETVEIMLWRTATDRFHVEVWKSFAPWLLDALVANAGDLV